MKTKLVLTLTALALTVPAVKAQETATGAAVGAVAGAAIGAHNHNPVGGVIAGALVGGLIGNAIEANKEPTTVVVQAPPPPPQIPTVIPTPPPPPPLPVTINYVWGPLDRWGHPTYVYVQEWNGYEWITTYYPYRTFLGWYHTRWGYAFREDMYRHHWHR